MRWAGRRRFLAGEGRGWLVGVSTGAGLPPVRGRRRAMREAGGELPLVQPDQRPGLDTGAELPLVQPDQRPGLDIGGDLALVQPDQRPRSKTTAELGSPGTTDDLPTLPQPAG